MHKRDAPCLFGRSQVVPVVVLCQRRFRQRCSSSHGGPSVDGGHHDSIAETRRGFSGGSLPSVWHDSLPKLWNQSVHHFNSHCPPEREQIAWATSSEPHRCQPCSDSDFDRRRWSHVHRSAMLSKLLEVPALQGLLPFARFAYGETTTCVWEDEEGVRHQIRQGIHSCPCCSVWVSTTRSPSHRRPWGMATWLAVQRVFRFQHEHHFRETVVLARSCAGDQAHLRSHSGPRGRSSFPWFTCRARVPSATHAFPDTRVGKVAPSVASDRGQMRMCWPERHFWKTQSRLSTFWPVEKAVPTERTLARVCREAGATVTRKVKLRDMNVQVSATDEREIEVVAAGIPIHHGAQLAVDITLKSAVTSVGAPRATAATVNGAALLQARRDKEAKYAELVTSERCRLVVVALETGGRWSTEALEFVADLASSRARDAPPVLRRSAFLAWRKRWTRMLSVSCARAFATSLVVSHTDAWAGVDGSAPDLADLYREG